MHVLAHAAFGLSAAVEGFLFSRLEAAVFLRLPAARSEGTTSDSSTTASSVLWDLGDLLFEADICAAVLNFLPICSRVCLLQTAADVNRPARASLYHIAVTTPTLSSAAGSRPF